MRDTDKNQETPTIEQLYNHSFGRLGVEAPRDVKNSIVVILCRLASTGVAGGNVVQRDLTVEVKMLEKIYDFFDNLEYRDIGHK